MKTNYRIQKQEFRPSKLILKFLLGSIILLTFNYKSYSCSSPDPNVNLCAPFELTRGNSFVGAQVVSNGSYTACPGDEEWFGVNYIGGTDAFLEYTVYGGEITGISGDHTNPLPPAQTFGSYLNTQEIIAAGYDIETYPRIKVKWYNLGGASFNYGITVRTNKSGVFGACGPRLASFDFTVYNVPSTGITANIGNSVSCINYGGTFNIPSVQGASYQWKLNGININGATNSSVYISNFSQASNTISVVVNLPCFSKTYDYVVTVDPNANLSSVASQFSPKTITPDCYSTTKSIYIPYVDGSSKFTLTIPTTQSWYFQSTGTKSITVNENTSVTLVAPRPLNTSSFQISASLTQSCGGARNLPSGITVNAYNPLPTGISLTGPSTICKDNNATGTFSVNNPINGATYTWSLNSTQISSIYYNPNGQNYSSLSFPVSGSSQAASVGSNNISVTLSNVPCMSSSTTYTYSTNFTASAIGEVTPNPATVDPSTGKVNICVTGGSANNTYDWNPAPNGYSITSPIGGIGSNCAEFTLTNINGVGNANTSVSINNAVCGTQSRQFVINSSIFSYNIQPSFSTACVGNSVTLNISLQGGRKPYTIGTWKTRNPAQQSLIISQNATSCTVQSPIAQFVTVYYDVKDVNNVSATGADATINFSNSANSGNGGWASGQLVNTACATNYVVLSNNFLPQYNGNSNHIFFIGNDNQLHYYYFDRLSQYCSGSTSWVEDQGLEGFFTGPISLGALSRRPKSGTPIAGGIDFGNTNQLAVYYINNSNSALMSIEGSQGQVNTYSNAFITNLPKNLVIDGSKLYAIDGNTIRRYNDLADKSLPFSPFSNINNVQLGSYLALIGSNLYYTGNNNSLWRTDINGISPVDLGKTMLTGTDIKEVDGNLVFLKDANTLSYYLPSNPSSSTDIPLLSPASGRLVPIASNFAASKSIFVTGTDGNQYQVYFQGTWKSLKATSSNVSDNSNGFITFNGSNVLYLTTGSNIWNLFGTGCGNFLRKAENEVIDSGNKYLVYPNPFNKSLNLEITTTEKYQSTIRIFDSLGKEVYAYTENSSEIGNRIHELNLVNLPKGVYLVKISVDNKLVSIQKLIAE